ncbi:MAG: hypothetical protein AAF802_31270 [Planctomycetota bacterium]
MDSTEGLIGTWFAMIFTGQRSALPQGMREMTKRSALEAAPIAFLLSKSAAFFAGAATFVAIVASIASGKRSNLLHPLV